MLKFSKRLDKFTYAVREFVPMAKTLEKKGKKIIYLNIGDPLKYDFETPKHIREGLCTAVEAGKNYYGDSQGELELRRAVAWKEGKYNNVKIAPEDVVITHGVSEGVNFLTGMLIDPGDEIILPDPVYPIYTCYTHVYGGKPVAYKCDERNGWQPDVDDIRRKITDRTKLIVIINPNNPTGGMYKKKTIKEILDLAAENKIPVASDEIYDRIVYEGKFESAAKLTNDTVVFGLNGFSKTYLMTGWRLGYVYIKDPTGKYATEVVRRFVKQCRLRLCCNTPTQIAGIKALRGPQKHIRDMVAKLKKRRDFAFKRINEIPGLEAVKPEGAFYIFPKIDVRGRWKDDREFVVDLLKKEGVLLVHGSGFGEKYGKNHFRSVLLPPIEILESGFNKLESFLRKR